MCVCVLSADLLAGLCGVFFPLKDRVSWEKEALVDSGTFWGENAGLKTEKLNITVPVECKNIGVSFWILTRPPVSPT